LPFDVGHALPTCRRFKNNRNCNNLWPPSFYTVGRRRLACGVPVRPPRVLPLVGLIRNAVFLTVVLVHALRRLLPPY